MNRTILFATFILLTLSKLSYVEARPQEKQAPNKQDSKQPDQATGSVEILSTSVVDSVDGIQGEKWTPAQPSSNKGLVVRIRVARGLGYALSDFGLGYKRAGKEQKANCIGATAILPDGWVFDERAKGWSLYPGGHGTLDGIGLLFLLPNDVNEVTLLYKGQPTRNPAPIKREQNKESDLGKFVIE